MQSRTPGLFWFRAPRRALWTAGKPTWLFLRAWEFFFWSGFILGCIVRAPAFVLVAVVKGRKYGKWPWDVQALELIRAKAPEVP